LQHIWCLGLDAFPAPDGPSRSSWPGWRIPITPSCIPFYWQENAFKNPYSVVVGKASRTMTIPSATLLSPASVQVCADLETCLGGGVKLERWQLELD
jgi:hypothetical protein